MCLVQSTLNNNILSLTGIAPGTATLSVCSAGGACTQLSALVNGVSTSGQLTFSNNNLTLLTGASATISLYGSSGYYISNSTNQNVASLTLSGSQVTVSALTAGSANATICQTGGQCSVLYVAVTSNTPSSTPPAFNPSTPSVAVGANVNVQVYGGVSSNYYVSSNSNTSIVQTNFSGNILTLTGEIAGSAVINVCAASNNCNSLPVTVTSFAAPVVATSATSTPTAATAGTTSAATGDAVLATNANEAAMISGGNEATITGMVSATRNTTLEASNMTQYIKPLLSVLNLATAAINNLDYFVVYGTPLTLKLGAGERAGVLSSYKQAYGKLPVSAAEWSDLIKIGVGRWPTETSASAVASAKTEFTKIYKRAANMSNSTDANAITIIAYGLRTTVRNTNSEKVAILSFQSVYGHAPINPLAWNIVRAIAYSGASK